MSEVLIHAENVSKKFCRSLKRSLWYGLQDMSTEALGRKGNHDQLRTDEFWAVNNVSFELRRGESLGLIGRNGAGKTTLLKILNGLIKPDHGRIVMRGRVGALIALGSGFNPILTGRENVYVNASILGLSKRQIDAKIDEIIDFAELREFIDAPVRSYSSGMTVRLGFAVAAVLQPDILLLDEVLAVGDLWFREKCILRISQLLQRCAVIFVSHNSPQIERICNQAILLERGSVKFAGLPLDALRLYHQIQSPTGFQKPVISVDDPVTSFELVTPYLNRLNTGDDLTLSFRLKTSRPVTVDHMVVTMVSESEEIIGHSTVRPPPLCIESDANLECRLFNLRLRAGTYHVSVVLSGRLGKQILARAARVARMEFAHGHCASGYASYQPMVSLARPGEPHEAKSPLQVNSDKPEDHLAGH